MRFGTAPGIGRNYPIKLLNFMGGDICVEPMKEHVVGIDIGGTKLATVIADKTGHILNKVRKPTLSEKGPEYALGLLFDMVREVVDLAGLERKSISAIGVSCGGPLDTKTGIVYSPPNLPGWDALPLKAKLESEFQVPVTIENDANASALAEFRFGGGRGYNAVLYMTMSTGIGGGIVINGQVYHGANDSAGRGRTSDTSTERTALWLWKTGMS